MKTAMPPVDPTVLQKLQKILSRADTSRGATEAEAQAAMAAAQRLAIQHNLDLAAVMASGPAETPGKLETDKVELVAPNKHRPYSIPIAHVLQECFDVHVIWVGLDARAVLIGEKTDVQLAAYCWSWLQQTFPRLFRRYCDERGLPFMTGIPRRSYYEGLSRGIRENNRRERAEAKADKATGQTFALVLVKKEEVVKNRVAEEFPQLRHMANRSRTVDHNALCHGWNEGRKIKLSAGLTEGSQERLT